MGHLPAHPPERRDGGDGVNSWRERMPKLLGPPGSSRRAAWWMGMILVSALAFAADGIMGLVQGGPTGRVWRAAVFSVWPVVVAIAVNRERIRRIALERDAAGLCPACGYDLRETPGRCPECGAEPEDRGP